MAAHILIIDDNADNLGILAEMLTMEGIDYTAVQNPGKLEGKLGTTKFNAVFLDLEMPNINGYELFEKLKADARFKNVPIVAYTVHVSEINVVRDMGFHSFIGKPLDVDAFPDQIARILRGERVWVSP
jgi:two-component system, cell cycle response regulator DivK